MFRSELLLMIFAYLGNSKCATNTSGYLEKIIKALETLSNFVYSDYKNMNIDGYFGMARAEAYIDLALLQASPLLDRGVIDTKTANRIRDIRNVIRKSRDLIYPLLPEKPYKYLVLKDRLSLTQIWRRDLGYRHGNFSKNPLTIDTGPFDLNTENGFYKYIENETFSETISDQCIVEALTSSEQPVVHDYSVSKKCYYYMIYVQDDYDSTFQLYGAAHRLLFLQVARAWGCKIYQNGFNELARQLCGYIYWEAKKLMKYQNDPYYQDIIIEQVEICGLDGFLEFFEDDFLQFVLNQQTPEGCYGITYSPKTENRQKRETTEMKFGCNSHTTGLAIDTLSIILKYVLWSMPTDLKT